MHIQNFQFFTCLSHFRVQETHAGSGNGERVVEFREREGLNAVIAQIRDSYSHTTLLFYSEVLPSGPDLAVTIEIRAVVSPSERP